jgi:hypothetical protein
VILAGERATAGRAVIFSRHATRRGQRWAIAISGNMRPPTRSRE